jgi:hypothetical protein
MGAALRSPVVRGAVAALGVAAATLVVARPAVGYDPYNWVIWGREILHGSLDTRGGTAWKPLPVFFTVLLAPAGPAAPVLWLVIDRAVAVAALIGIVRVGARLAGPAAGIVAAVAVVLIGDQLISFWTGTADWLLVAPAVWAIDSALARRRVLAFGCLCAAGLVRPEAWPFMAIAGLWVLREDRSRLALVAGLGLAVPLAWLVPQWIGSGSPFAGQQVVLRSPGAAAVRHAREPWHLVAVRFRLLVGGWLILTALAGALVELRARRPQCALLLAGAALWIGIVAAMAQAGYPGLARFMLPAALAVCLAAGVAVERAASSLRGHGTVATLVAAALVGAWLVPVIDRGMPNLRRQRLMGQSAVQSQDDLAAAVARAGGAGSVLGCGALHTWWAAEPLVHWLIGGGVMHSRGGGLVVVRERLRRHAAYLPSDPPRSRLRMLGADREWELQGRCARTIVRRTRHLRVAATRS